MSGQRCADGSGCLAIAARIRRLKCCRKDTEELDKRPENRAVITARKVEHRMTNSATRRMPNDTTAGNDFRKERRRDGDLLIIRNLKTGNVEDRRAKRRLASE